jgi:Zn-finger protein
MDCFSRADPLGPERKVGRGWNKSLDPTPLTIMSCKACGLVHSPLVRCEVAKRVINANTSVINDAPVINRQVEWQRANKDRYNARMREYMRTYRLGKKNST